jgi:lipopolysaccharide biosynthesis glycosyltransferase
MEKINIVLAADNNYAQHAAVAMTSILMNTRQPGQVQFYLIDDGIDAASQEKITATVQKWQSAVSFVQPPQGKLQDVFVSGNLTRAAYYRLAIADILPVTVQKVIYLDCDLLVLQDIVALWQLDMQGQPLSAAEDFGILASKGKCAEKQQSFGWQAQDSYFNSGVLILDLAQWREQAYTDKLLRLVVAKHYRHHDQDALNEVFLGHWCKLPLRWNVIPPVFNMPLRVAINKKYRLLASAALRDPAVIHYAGGYKPWEYPEQQGFNEKYYYYLAQSTFQNAHMPQPNPRKKGHSLQRQMWRLKWGQFVSGLNRKQ